MSTAYMNLNLPVVGPLGTLGPTWASDLNTAINSIDSHDHSTGKGKQITPSGININQTLSMNTNSLIGIVSLALNDLDAQVTDKNYIYEYGGELWFNDDAGNLVQLTSGGTINVASIGTITGDYATSTADLTYSDIAKTFIFKQSPTVSANVDCGPVKIYQNIASSPYARIQQNAAQSTDLNWYLPTSYPAATYPVTSTNAGVLSTSQIIASMIATDAVETAKIKDLNVTTGKINDLAVTTGKIANDAVTELKIPGSALSSGLTGGGGTRLSVDVDNNTLNFLNNTVRVKPGGITNSEVASSANIQRNKLQVPQLTKTVTLTGLSTSSSSLTAIYSGTYTTPTGNFQARFEYVCAQNSTGYVHLNQYHGGISIEINGVVKSSILIGSDYPGNQYIPPGALNDYCDFTGLGAGSTYSLVVKAFASSGTITFNNILLLITQF